MTLRWKCNDYFCRGNWRGFTQFSFTEYAVQQGNIYQ